MKKILIYLLLVTNLLADPSPGSLSPNISENNSLYVDITNGNDASGTRGKKTLPFLSIRAAESNANSGDVVYTLPGTYVGSSNLNMGKDGVTYYFYPKIFIAFNGTSTANDAVFRDNSNPVNFSVLGYGSFAVTNTGADVSISVLHTINVNSVVRVEGVSAIATRAGASDGVAFRCAGGTNYINVKYIYGKSNAAGMSVSGSLQDIICETADAGSYCFYCPVGKQYVNFIHANGTDAAFACQGGTEQVAIGQTVTSPDTGFVCNGGTQRAKVSKINVTLTGIDSTGGNQIINCEDLTAGSIGINMRAGAGTCRASGRLITAPQVLNGKLGTFVGYFDLWAGNSATASVQFPNDANTSSLAIGGLIVNSDASAPVISYLGTNKSLALFGGAALISQSGSSKSIDTSLNHQNLKVYGNAVQTKALDTNITVTAGTMATASSGVTSP